MPSSMLVHDSRLAGRPPNIAPNSYEVNEKVSIDHAIGWISTYARMSGRLTNLFVMCHGYEAGVEDPFQRVSTYALGYGLQLCTEGLTNVNIAKTSALRGLVDTITLFSCGPANTRPGWDGYVGDGRRFCGEMALYSGAEVIAASQTQYYLMDQSLFDRLLRRPGVIDFGEWEGPVYRFGPDGSSGRVQ